MCGMAIAEPYLRQQASRGAAFALGESAPAPGFSVQRAQKVNHRTVDFSGALLLGPVATAWEHDCIAQLWHETPKVRDDLIHPRKPHD
jgi:hypothetical protein